MAYGPYFFLGSPTPFIFFSSSGSFLGWVDDTDLDIPQFVRKEVEGLVYGDVEEEAGRMRVLVLHLGNVIV